MLCFFTLKELNSSAIIELSWGWNIFAMSFEAKINNVK